MAAPAVLFSGPSIVISQADSAKKALSWHLCCHNVKQNLAPLPHHFPQGPSLAGQGSIESEKTHRGDMLSDKVQLDADIKKPIKILKRK